MNLEQLEERVVKYLEQVENPLVPLSRLLRHLAQSEDGASIAEPQLIGFLRENPLFRLIEPLDTGVAPGDADAAGEIRVILSARVPSPAELVGQMKAELNTLLEALEAAKDEAQRDGEAGRVAAIEQMQARTEELRSRIQELP